MIRPGQRLGRYEILQPVGAGGMGEVYRARDTRLDRLVALKLLPDDFRADREWRQRFEREARVLATLNHPSICPIYDLGQEQGVDFLVMELLEGRTLAGRLAEGPLPLPELLRDAARIAQALAAAHQRGIVHRDLKPGNVFLTPSGPKLLDFGLAKRLAAKPGAETVAADPVTSVGTLVGTFQYMAPEQAEGRDLDERADLFALGAVIYEMATGRAPFARPTPAATLAAVLHDDPPSLASLRPDVPQAVVRLVDACLRKDRDSRWASAHDAAIVLEHAGDEASAVVHGPAGSFSRMPWAVAAAAVLVALAAVAATYLGGAPPQPVRRLALLPPPGIAFALEETPQISPDGRRLLFVGRDEAGGTRLHVRALDAAEAKPLPGTDGATLPFWAPDSRRVGFFADGLLKVLDELEGATARTLTRATTPRGASWSRDDRILFLPFPAQALHSIPVAGGTPTPVQPPPTRPPFRWFPQWLPDGRRYLHMAYSGGRAGGDITVASVDDDSVTVVGSATSSPVYAEPGYLLFRRDDRLIALPFDGSSGRTGGSEATLLSGLMLNPITNQAPFSVSNDGVLAFVETTRATQVSRFDRAGARLGDLTPPGNYNSLCVVAGGGRVVVDGGDVRDSSMDIWMSGRSLAGFTRLSYHEGVDFFPTCSPDGREVVFASLRGGPPDLYRVDMDVPGTETLLLDTPVAKIPSQWSDDGRWLLFMTLSTRGDWDVWGLPLADGGEPRALVATAAEEREGRLSPDGRWLAYSSNESGRYEIWVQPFPATGARWQVSRDGGVQPQWRGDGQELFYLSGARLLTAVDVQLTGGGLQFGDPRQLFRPRVTALEPYTAASQYVVSPSGDSFIVNRLSDEATSRAVTVLLNWPALFRR